MVNLGMVDPICFTNMSIYYHISHCISPWIYTYRWSNLHKFPKQFPTHLNHLMIKNKEPIKTTISGRFPNTEVICCNSIVSACARASKWRLALALVPVADAPKRRFAPEHGEFPWDEWFFENYPEKNVMLTFLNGWSRGISHRKNCVLTMKHVM